MGGGNGKASLAAQLETLRARTKLLQQQLGLHAFALPHADIDASVHDILYWRNVKFVQMALKDRQPDVIAAALKRNGQIAALVETAVFQPSIKAAIAQALLVIQEHWSARHAVFVMSIQLSNAWVVQLDTWKHCLRVIQHVSTQERNAG